MIPKDKWKWYGAPAHFCCAPWCCFHLATEVGKYVVSTVGEYFPPHATERDRPEKPTNIGCDRLYETMVFKKDKGRCKCGCGAPMIKLTELDFLPYNGRKEANKGHMDLCKKWSLKQ